MFERFSDDARQAMVRAQEEARSLRHGGIGPAHLALGLLHDDRSELVVGLGTQGIDVARVRAAVTEHVGHGDGPAPGHVPFTPQAKEALEFALRESLQVGQATITPTHIMLGVLRGEDPVVPAVLSPHGIDDATVRALATRATRAPQGASPGVLRRAYRGGARAPTSVALPLLLERFDDAAWEVLMAARRSARRHGRGDVDCRDVLMGVATVPGPGAEALQALGRRDAWTGAAWQDAGAASAPQPAALAFTARVRDALHRAALLAERLGHPAAGTGHILLALLEDSGDEVDRLVEAAGVSHDDLRAAVSRRLA